MAGVEILATQKIVIEYAFNWQVYLIMTALIAVIMTFTSCLINGFYFENVIIGLIIGVIFGAIFGLFPATNTTPSEYETRYKVTVSDEVSMNEFLDQYEIIGQEGKIYTVREIK